MTAPTLLLEGSETASHHTESTALVHETLPNSRVVVFEGEGYVAMNTAPERFVEEMFTFAGASTW